MTNIDNHSNSNSNNDNGAHANDNGAHERQEKASGDVAFVPTEGALTSLAALEALGTALNKVNTASVGGLFGKLLLQYKSRENTWMYGPRGTVPEKDSRWAANPLSLAYGYVCFSDAKKWLGEVMTSVTKPMPARKDLPDLGFPWQEQWAVDLKCITGADAGVEPVFKSTTDGGKRAIIDLLVKVRDRLNGGLHDGKMAPVMCLTSESYPHNDFGRVWKPVLEIVDWMPIAGPAPASKPTSPPPAPSTSAAEQPRRRRVV